MPGRGSRPNTTASARSDPAERALHHLEMAVLAARGIGSARFFEHVARARALCGGSSEKTAPGTLSPRQRQRAEDLLVASLEGRIAIDEIAAACGLSRGHFTRAFTKTVGVPPREWQLGRRVETAKGLMLEPGRTLSEIAAAVGFADQSHLSRTFKRTTGMSPSEYRRRSAKGTGER